MTPSRTFLLAAVVAMALGACNGEDAEVTVTTIDPSLLTTTTGASTATTQSDSTEPGGTTEAASDTVDDYEVISRTASEEGETLYILVPPGNYSDVSIENFLGDLLESETAVSGAEIFDDRTALDAALKPEEDRTADELQAIEDHHLVSLIDGRTVAFRGPMSDYDDFVIGS